MRMIDYVMKFLEFCQACQQEDSDDNLTKGKLQNVQLAEKRLQEISLDFISDPAFDQKQERQYPDCS